MNDAPPLNPKEAARKEREERLAAALRANLRRRKAAARPAPEVPASAPPEAPQKPDLPSK